MTTGERDVLQEAEADLEDGDSALDVARRYVHRASRDGRIGELRNLVDDYSPGAADGVFLDHLLRNGGPGPAAAGAASRAAPPRGGAPGTGPVVTLSDVEPETVRWLWPDRIPVGKLTMLDGDPGLLKSTIMVDISARLSRGAPMPDGTEPEVEGPAGTVLLTAEDGLADTVRPRLDAAGGDPGRVAVVKHVPTADGEPRLPHVEDTPELARALNMVEARLLVVDPLMAFLPSDVNSHRDQDVRRALAPLVELADDAGVAVVAIRHLNKSGGSNPKYRGGGSIGLIGAARSGLMVAEDPDAPETRRVLAATKANLSEPAPSLAYRPVQADNGAVRVEWEGESEHAAHALLETPSGEERTARDEAKAFLRAELADGPRPAKELRSRAEDELGLSRRTLKRAKRDLGVESHREGGRHGSWMWELPKGGQGGVAAFEGQGGGTLWNGPEGQGDSGDRTPKGGQGSDVAPFDGDGDVRRCACGTPLPDGDARCAEHKARVAEMYMALPDPDRVVQVDGEHPHTPRP